MIDGDGSFVMSRIVDLRVGMIVMWMKFGHCCG